MIKSVLKKVFGTSNDREVKRLWPMVTEINAKEKSIQALTDEQLQAKTTEFKEKLSKGASLDDILVEAFGTKKYYSPIFILCYILHCGKEIIDRRQIPTWLFGMDTPGCAPLRFKGFLLLLMILRILGASGQD